MFRYGHGISEKKMLTYEDDGYKVVDNRSHGPLDKLT
jgi:hypothetical protein